VKKTVQTLILIGLIFSSPLSAGVINTIAGNGIAALSGNGGAALNASLVEPFLITFDAQDNLYIQNPIGDLREVDNQGVIHSLIPQGIQDPFFGDQTTPNFTLSTERHPVDSLGNRYYSDGQQIFKIDALGVQTVIAGIIPLAGARYSFIINEGDPALRFLKPVYGTLALDNNDNLYFKSFTYILRLNSSNPANPILNIIASEARGDLFNDIIFDNNNNLYISNEGRHQVLILDPVTLNQINVIGTSVAGFSGDGGSAKLSQLNVPTGLSIDSYGDLYIAEIANSRVRRVDLNAPTATLTLNNGASPTNGNTINLTINCQDGPHGSGCQELRLSNDGITWNPWQIFTSTLNWTLSAGDGLKTVYLQLRDAGGNGVANSSNTIKQSLILDTVAPNAAVILSPIDGFRSNNGTLSISGFSEPNSTIKLFSSNGSRPMPLALNSADTSGRWSLNHTFADGSYTLTANASDSAGNVSTLSQAVTLQIDSVAPPAPLITTPSNGSSTQTSIQTITGSAEANSSVQIFDNGTPLNSVTVDAMGNWSTLLQFATGNHLITATATDTFGNTSLASAAINFTLSTPTPIIITPPTGSAGAVSLLQTVNTPTINLATQCTPGSNGALCTLMRFSNDGTNWSPWRNYSPNARWTLSVGDGSKTVFIQFQDSAGNVSQTFTTQLILDTQPPNTPTMEAFNSLAANSNELITNKESQRLSGRAEANSTLEIFSEGVSLGIVNVDNNGVWVRNWQFNEGNHILTTRSRDAAGNLSSRSNEFLLTIDITTPIITLIGGSDIQIMAGSDYIDAGATASDTLDGDLSGKITTPVTRKLLDTTQSGSYFIHYQVTDRAGNITTTQRKITVLKAADCSNISSSGIKNRKADCTISGFGAPAKTQSGGGSLNNTLLLLLLILLFFSRQTVLTKP